MQAPVLTRNEIQKLGVYVALNQNVERVQIIQNRSSGIGNTTHARCYIGEQYTDIDITDYEAW